MKKQSHKDELIRELGTPQQQAQMLLRKRKYDEAMVVLRYVVRGLPGLLHQFADELLAAGKKELAVQLVQENTKDQRNSSTAYQWLVNYYENHGALEEVVNAQLQLFLIYPNFEAFKILAEKSRNLGNWNPVRAAAMKKV